MSWPRYRFAQNGLGSLLLSPRMAFARQEILRLGPVAWFRYNTGITIDTGVSQWDDQSGNGNHLKQSTGANQPAKQSDGSILFDGASDFLSTGAITLNQPETVYILFQQVSWTSGGTVFDGGNVTNTMRLFQNSATPELDMFSNTSGPVTTDLAVGAYGVVVCVFNGTSSMMQVNDGTVRTSVNNLSLNGAGFTLGARPGGSTFGNVQVKEAIIFAAAHDTATRSTISGYLKRVGGL